MNFKKTGTRNICLLILILLVGTGFRLAVMSQSLLVTQSGYSSYMKSTLNYVDRVQTMQAQEGQWRDSSELFEKLFTLENGEISYPALYKQLESSNHPPLYYYILHTVIGLSKAKKASLLLGFLVNLVASWVTLVLVYFLGLNLFNNHSLALFSAFLFAVSFLTMEVFVVHKAYELQITSVMLVFFLLFRAFDKEKVSLIDYAFYGIACLLAFLLHYFSYLYIAGICLIIFVHYAWIRRDFIKLLSYGVITSLSAAASFLIYPPTIRDFMTDIRAQQIREVLVDPGGEYNNKIYTEIFMFKAWFLTAPHILIVLSITALIILAILIKKQDFRISRFFSNKKYLYIVSYFIFNYCLLLYIAPYNNLRYIAPLLPLFLLMLAGLLQYIPKSFQLISIYFFVPIILLFNIYSLTNVARGEIPGSALIGNSMTRSALEQTAENSSVILVSIMPKERIMPAVFHAPPRRFAYCEKRIPEDLFHCEGEMLILIDRLLSPKNRDYLVNVISGHGFEEHGQVPGLSSYRRSVVPGGVD